MNLQPTADKPPLYYSIIDMSMVFHLSTPSPEDREKKWIDYVSKIATMVHIRNPDDDCEKEYTIKDDDRGRRAANYPDAGNKFPKFGGKFLGPKEFRALS